MEALNPYVRADFVEKEVNRRRHRSLIGGLWDEIGLLQFDFIVSRGLRPHHTLVDIGCGCLRGGVHFVNYLDAGKYVGTDLQQSLLDVGYDVELKALRLQHKLPRENLICESDFSIGGRVDTFDYAIAQSVFTHIPLSHIYRCLERVAPAMKPNGLFYATFFERPADHNHGRSYTHDRAGVTTHSDRDPFHFSFAEMEALVVGLPWECRLVGDWNHPRGQRMLEFKRV
jgi:SAM-dependent methyltransferase